MSVAETKYKFAIDRGGTFTDIWAKCPNGKVKVTKLLSVDPQNYPDAPREGIRRIIEQVTLSFRSTIKPVFIKQILIKIVFSKICAYVHSWVPCYN